MNLNLPTLAIISAGLILVYAAVKNKDPRDVVRMGFNMPAKHGPLMNVEQGWIKRIPPASSGGGGGGIAPKFMTAPMVWPSV